MDTCVVIVPGAEQVASDNCGQYRALALKTRTSADYRYVEGQLRRSK